LSRIAIQTILDLRQTRTVDLKDVDPAAGGPAGITVTWRGAWDVPADDFYRLGLEAAGAARWLVDDAPAIAMESHETPASRMVWLNAGFHPIELQYTPALPAAALRATIARNGEEPSPPDAWSLKPRSPRNPHLRSLTRLAADVCAAIAAIALVIAARRWIRLIADAWHRRRDARVDGRPAVRYLTGPVARRTWAWIALAMILVHGSLLRLDVITARYGSVTSPRWLAAIQNRTILPPHTIRPASMHWSAEPLYPHADGQPTRYRSDPYTYLSLARTMTSFYWPHYREPVFPFATRTMVHALDGQDVAVSFTSALFSVMAIWFTYLLGASLWSRAAGLLAALALAIDGDVVSVASLGWRDDAYVAMVTGCACLMLSCWRAVRTADPPTTRRRFGLDAARVEAIRLGVAGGFAILTRVMIVPFLVVGALAMLLFEPVARVPWRRRLAAIGLAGIAGDDRGRTVFPGLLAGAGRSLVHVQPARQRLQRGRGRDGMEGHDRFIHVAQDRGQAHGHARHGRAGSHVLSVRQQVSRLDRWTPGLGAFMAGAALIGLAIVTLTSDGRRLLVAYVASLLPFAFTWKVDPNYRFTEHVYPALLVASAVTIVVAARAVRALSCRGSGTPKAGSAVCLGDRGRPRWHRRCWCCGWSRACRRAGCSRKHCGRAAMRPSQRAIATAHFSATAGCPSCAGRMSIFV
jgi:hypothetical protein